MWPGHLLITKNDQFCFLALSAEKKKKKVSVTCGGDDDTPQQAAFSAVGLIVQSMVGRRRVGVLRRE